MAKEPIRIVKTDGTINEQTADEIAREIMQDIEKTKADLAADESPEQ